MKRNNDNLTKVNRNWKIRVNGRFVGLFGLYNQLGDFYFQHCINMLNGECMSRSFATLRFARSLVVTAYAK